jgi:hypothetical protein
MLGRNNHEKLWECPKVVTSFLREADFMEVPDGHNGLCGTRKDHRRVYCCQVCRQLDVTQ